MYSTVLSFPGRYKKRHTFSLASTHRECFKIYLVVEQYVCNEMAIFYICSLHSIAWKCSRLLSFGPSMSYKQVLYHDCNALEHLVMSLNHELNMAEDHCNTTGS